MKSIYVLFLSFIMIQTNSFCQEYVVDLEERNKMIDLVNKALVCIKNHKTDEALSLLTTVVTKDSVFRAPYIYLYSVYAQKSDYAESVTFYLKKAQRIFLEDDEISFYLGEIYRINSELKNAIIEYSHAINWSKKNGEDFSLTKLYYFNRGNCYFKLNEIDSALTDFNYSIKLHPDNPSALLNRGICLFKKGSKIEACEDWKKASLLGNKTAKEYLEKICK